MPIPVEAFIAYGEWVQERAVPDLHRREVVSVDRQPGGFSVRLADGDELTAARVVVACGIAKFASSPPQFADVPRELATHTSEHGDFQPFAGRRVAVVGGGQSALESAALLAEAGADVDVLVRANRIVWLRGVGVKQRLGRLGPIVYAPTDVGPLWYSRLVAQPNASLPALPTVRPGPDRPALHPPCRRALASGALEGGSTSRCRRRFRRHASLVTSWCSRSLAAP